MLTYTLAATYEYLSTTPFLCSSSKVQARFAFSTYLLRVQQRLLLESDAIEANDEDQATEQMVCLSHLVFSSFPPVAVVVDSFLQGCLAILVNVKFKKSTCYSLAFLVQ